MIKKQVIKIPKLEELRACIKIPEPKDMRACLLAAEELLEQITELHGFETACSLFHLLCDKPTRNQIKNRRNTLLALQFYRMSKPNKDKLAALLAKQNETLPDGCKWGPTGTTNPANMRKQIVRALKRNKYRPSSAETVEAG